jgi:hypothetical protein
MQTISPTASDSQSVGSGLPVRRDGQVTGGQARCEVFPLNNINLAGNHPGEVFQFFIPKFGGRRKKGYLCSEMKKMI